MKFGDKSPRSHSQDSAGIQQSVGTGELEIHKKKSSDPPVKSSATGSTAPKNYYHEFKKVQETFRRNSGLLVSQSFGTKEI